MNMRFINTVSCAASMAALISCSTLQKDNQMAQVAGENKASDNSEQTANIEATVSQADSDKSVVAPVSTALFTEGVWKKDLVQAIGEPDYQKLGFNFHNAEVHLSKPEKAPKHKKNEPKPLGKIEIKLLKGDAHCRFELKEQAPHFEMIDEAARTRASAFSRISGLFKSNKSRIPAVSNCEYLVDIKMYETYPVEFNLKKADLFVENWDKPLTVNLDWGTIDLQTVGMINVKCGDCDLTGEKIKGAVQFNLDNGNVGLSGLTTNVDGITYGDTVLKWEKLAVNTSVKLVSRAGDVILQFPRGSRLSLDVKVPKGEIFSKKGKVEEESGIPVSITAEAGNVKLYR